MRIACVSDTHMDAMGLYKFPKADVLVHAGDITFRGTEKELKFVAEHLGKHYKDSRHHDGYQRIYFVPGNHDWLFQTNEMLAREIFMKHNIIVLINESDVYEGIKFWGSPVCPPFHNWAFYLPDKEREDLWRYIPEDTDVLITHGPPKFMRDEVHEYMKVKYCGCEYLANRVKAVKPKAHIFGHIHEGYGVTKGDHTLFVNPSLMDGGYRPENDVILIDITDGEATLVEGEYEHYDGHTVLHNMHVPFDRRNY
jgi:Icc-related predicted phosphoesterase